MIKYKGMVFRNLQEQVAKNMEDIETLKKYEGYMGPYATTSAIPEEDLNQDWLYLVGNAAPYELYKYNADGTFTDLGLFPLAGPKGDTGDTGPEGVGIVSVTKTGTSGLVDTYTITLSNGQTSTFTVTNGEKGDTGDTGNTGPQGVGIVSVTKTGTSGLVDTYTITLSNGQTSTFTVTNGANQLEHWNHVITITRTTNEVVDMEVKIQFDNYTDYLLNSFQKIIDYRNNGVIPEVLLGTGYLKANGNVYILRYARFTYYDSQTTTNEISLVFVNPSTGSDMITYINQSNYQNSSFSDSKTHITA